jgi:hypothetical protein
MVSESNGHGVREGDTAAVREESVREQRSWSYRSVEGVSQDL